MAESQNIRQLLLFIQKTLKAPKGQFNNFGKYNYRSAEDILEAVKPLNAEKGLLLTIYDEPVMSGDWHYIKATAVLKDTNSEEEIVVTAFAREPLSKKGMDESQITGTASSYARKYALNGLYLIDDTKDSDSNESQTQQNNAPQQPSDQQPQSNDQFNNNKNEVLMRINAVAQKTGSQPNDLLTWVLNQTNQQTGTQDSILTPSNINIAVGFVKRMELQAGGNK